MKLVVVAAAAVPATAAAVVVCPCVGMLAICKLSEAEAN